MNCPRCGYKNDDTALTCNLCGELLRRMGRPGTEAAPKGTEAEPTSAEEEDARLVLHCFPLDPVILEKDRPITIGRSKNSELVLPVGMVSREHASVTWNGKEFELRDLGSSNGTFVNDKEIKTHALRAGDVVKIGPYQLNVRAFGSGLQEMMSEGPMLDRTQNMTRREVFGKAATFSGKIGEMQLSEVVQLIEFNQKTGVLEVEDGKNRGSLFFRGGQLLDAQFADLTGEGAVAEFLVLATGSFHFDSTEPRVERKIFQSTAKVVLDALRKLDEKGKG